MSKTSKQGDVAVARFLYEFTLHGVQVALPLSDSLCYDMLIDFNNHVSRVQCKSATRSDGDKLSVKLQRTHVLSERNVYKNYAEEDFDLLAVYDAVKDKCYLLPSSAWANKGGITLWFRPTREKQSLLCRDFELSVVLQTINK